MKPPIDIDGRWLSKPLTGTGRYSAEVTKALIESGRKVVLWVPQDAVIPAWAHRARVRRMRSMGQWFEQVALPIRTAGRPLLAMGGPAPAFKRLQVVVLHDATPFRLPQTYSRAFAAWYRWLYRRIAGSGAAIATVSSFSAAELADVLSTPESALVIASPAATISATARRPAAELPDRYFLTVGTLAAHKNLQPVISAFADAGLSVVMVGTAGVSRVFASVADAKRKVVRLGRVDDEELRWLYEHAQALLFPSLYEGFGLPALEAQLAGCPVIASTAGPLPEVLGDSAVLLDPHDPASFVAAARRVLETDGLRDDLVGRGRRNAARFAWSRTASTLANAISAL